MTNWVKVATTSDFTDGEPVYFDFEFETVAIFRLGDAFYAIEDRCSHDDGPLGEGQLDRAACEIVCPRHGARFDLRSGAALSMPAVYPVRRYEVRVEGEAVYLAEPDEGDG